jgi:hypothetical protein
MSHLFTAPERFRDELRDALLARAATLPAREPLPVPASPAIRRPWRLRARGPVAVWRLVPALALAAIVAAVLILRSGSALAPQPATAAGVLRASAAALDHLGGSRALGRGDYFYTRILEWWRYSEFAPHPYVVRSIEQEWVARDGRGRARNEVIGLGGAGVHRGLPLTRSSDARLRGSPRPFYVSPAPEIALSYAQLRSLPTNPARLGAAIDGLVARHPIEEPLRQREVKSAIRFEIVSSLAEAPTSAALRSALYQVLAVTPGIRLLGRTRDSIGRVGMAVGDRVGDIEFEVIIDPATGELLQASRTLLHRSKLYFDGKQPPGLIDRATFLGAGIVASTHARVP